MRTLHLGLALALLIGCAVSVEAAKAKGKKKAGNSTGVVTAVSKDSITIQVQQGKKNKDAAPVAKTFKINATTKFQHVKKVKGQKGPGEVTEGVLTDIQQGGRVTIQGTNVAETISILPKGKKKNK